MGPELAEAADPHVLVRGRRRICDLGDGRSGRRRRHRMAPAGGGHLTLRDRGRGGGDVAGPEGVAPTCRRLDQIGHKWRLNTPGKLKEGEPVLHGILSDPEYRIPLAIPDRTYEGAPLVIEPYEPIRSVEPSHRWSLTVLATPAAPVSSCATGPDPDPRFTPSGSRGPRVAPEHRSPRRPGGCPTRTGTASPPVSHIRPSRGPAA